MKTNWKREKRRRELDQIDLEYQSTEKYNTECGKCITRHATEEEIKKYGIKKGSKNT